MTKVEIRWVVDELERQSTPLSRSVLKLLQEMTSLPNRTEWVGGSVRRAARGEYQ